MEAEAANRPRSRILREMKANRLNPFNSPPSSTGSHGTMSPTKSTIFSEMDDSTRMLSRDIARVTAPRKLPINWDAASRKWPEYFSNGSKDLKPSGDTKAPAAHSHSTEQAKRNDRRLGAAKTQAEMQPRVENDSSNHSAVLPVISSRPASRRYASTHGVVKSSTTHHVIKESLENKHQQFNRASRRREGSSSPEHNEPRDNLSPNTSSAKSSLTAVAQSPNSVESPINNDSITSARSFVMPDVSHLEDFVTGTLKFHSMENKVPIFVKHGRVHDRQENPLADAYAFIDGIEVPEQEKNIFVSMDMLRDAIASLQEHCRSVQTYAHNLREQKERLEIQLKSQNKIKSNAHYSQETDLEAELQAKVTTLQAQLEQSKRKVTQLEDQNMSLVRERDRLANRLQTACEEINKLSHQKTAKEREIDALSKGSEATDQIRQENDTLQRNLVKLKHGRDSLELENDSLRRGNETLRQEIIVLQTKMESLRADNNHLRRVDDCNGLRQEIQTLKAAKSALQADNESLMRNNDQYYKENKVLCRENSSYERNLHELEDENFKLKDQVDLLKQQLDHCRPLVSQEISGRLDEQTFEDENMTSAFYVPDVTLQSNETEPLPAEVTQSRKVLDPQEHVVTSHEKQDHAVPLKNVLENQQVGEGRDGPAMSANVKIQKQSLSHRQVRVVESRASEAGRYVEKGHCPALSNDARLVLDRLCEHNCRNCIVCSRITSHGGVISRSDVAAGKKRVTVPRPVPVSDLGAVHADQTIRPAQSPGCALALAIKTAQDEALHLQLEVAKEQARYNALDASIGRKNRNALFERINKLRKHLNSKNDEIYNLYDVLEGQKVAGQVMSDHELEMTILNITGTKGRDSEP